jgi:hypothetical protein
VSLRESLPSAAERRSAIPSASTKRNQADRLLYWCAGAVTVLTASIAILAVAIAAVVLGAS